MVDDRTAALTSEEGWRSHENPVDGLDLRRR